MIENGSMRVERFGFAAFADARLGILTNLFRA
jgi:hypothetical protein